MLSYFILCFVCYVMLLCVVHIILFTNAESLANSKDEVAPPPHLLDSKKQQFLSIIPVKTPRNLIRFKV